jgi:hypothetical protein
MLLFTKIPVASTQLAEAISASGFYPVETMIEPY